jgi:hypothetical protein
MSEQQKIRERYLLFLVSTGIRQNFIAEKTNIPNYVLSKYKQGKNELLDSSLKNLDNYLTEQGY